MKCKVLNIHLSEGLVESDISVFNDFLKTIKVSRIFSSIVNTHIPFWSVLLFYEDKSTSNTMPTEDIILTGWKEKIYEALRNWRNNQAAKENIQPYMVAYNRWLKQIVRIRIKSKEDLIHTKGLGEKRIAKYGDDIVEVFTSFQEERIIT